MDASKTPPQTEPTERKLATSIRERSWDLMDSLMQFKNVSFAIRPVPGFRRPSSSSLMKYDENIAISPLSIMGAMYMLAAASAGNSRKETLETIFFKNEIDEKDVKSIRQPFEAYFELIDQLQTQADGGYALNIGMINIKSHIKNILPISLEINLLYSTYCNKVVCYEL